MPLVTKSDVQGIILRGYQSLRDACFVLLRITDAEQCESLARGACRLTPPRSIPRASTGP